MKPFNEFHDEFESWVDNWADKAQDFRHDPDPSVAAGQVWASYDPTDFPAAPRAGVNPFDTFEPDYATGDDVEALLTEDVEKAKSPPVGSLPVPVSSWGPDQQDPDTGSTKVTPDWTDGATLNALADAYRQVERLERHAHEADVKRDAKGRDKLASEIKALRAKIAKLSDDIQARPNDPT